VDQALHILGAMKRVHGIAPWREHYTCVLDACGRAGYHDEAAEIFRRMPMKRDQQVLGAYGSSASSSKANGVSGEQFWERFLDGEVDAGGGTYALMSKSLADAGRWDDARAVRERMAARGIQKTTACTWIEV
jgi:pentatricopeptide repeat protein